MYIPKIQPNIWTRYVDKSWHLWGFENLIKPDIQKEKQNATDIVEKQLWKKDISQFIKVKFKWSSKPNKTLHSRRNYKIDRKTSRTDRYKRWQCGQWTGQVYISDSIKRWVFRTILDKKRSRDDRRQLYFPGNDNE